MTWVLLGVVAAGFVLSRFARRRRELFTVSPSEPISTLHMGTTRKRSDKTKAALDAASQVLR